MPNDAITFSLVVKILKINNFKLKLIDHLIKMIVYFKIIIFTSSVREEFDESQINNFHNIRNQGGRDLPHDDDNGDYGENFEFQIFTFLKIFKNI